MDTYGYKLIDMALASACIHGAGGMNSNVSKVVDKVLYVILEMVYQRRGVGER